VVTYDKAAEHTLINMTNIENGTEEATISSNETQYTLVLPEKDTIKQAMRINMLNRYFGMVELHYPVSLKNGNTELAFDFYNEEDEKLVKFLTPDDREIADAYDEHPLRKDIILVFEMECGFCMDCDDCFWVQNFSHVSDIAISDGTDLLSDDGTPAPDLLHQV